MGRGDENKNEYKRIASIKAVRTDDATNMYIEGYASVFGVVDSYNDIVERGSFVKTLAKDAKRVRFCFQHDLDQVVGKVEEMKEDEHGLFFRAKISNTTLGKDLATLVEDEALDEISFAYRTKDFVFDKETGIRHLKEVDLIEISLVTRAANERAIVTGAERKSEEVTLQEAIEIFSKSIDKLSDKELIAMKKKIDNDYITRIFKLIK